MYWFLVFPKDQCAKQLKSRGETGNDQMRRLSLAAAIRHPQPNPWTVLKARRNYVIETPVNTDILPCTFGVRINRFPL